MPVACDLAIWSIGGETCRYLDESAWLTRCVTAHWEPLNGCLPVDTTGAGPQTVTWPLYLTVVNVRSW